MSWVLHVPVHKTTWDIGKIWTADAEIADTDKNHNLNFANSALTLTQKSNPNPNSILLCYQYFMEGQLNICSIIY